MILKLAQRFLVVIFTIITIAIATFFWSRRRRRFRRHSEKSADKGGEDDTSLHPPRVREDGFQYDVFLSFRGADTRKGFTGHLYHALKDRGIVTFMDSETFEKGQKLEELFWYIERSKIFVIIFSNGYADSRWCLKEIDKIVKCKRLIIPVFFDVDPTVVRHQTGSFGRAFRRYQKSKNVEKEEMSRWKDALREAGVILGYNLADTEGNEAKLIQLIVKRILIEVNKTSLFVAKHQVGLDSRITDFIRLLDLEAQGGAMMFGIHGMGGIGKTTLAKAVYNQISTRFDGCSFISDIREAADQPTGLISLQEQLLRDVLKDEIVKVSSISHGIAIIKQRIQNKKVLLVLDDVNGELELDALAGCPDWFCAGSRVIITARDKLVLRAPRVRQNNVYELKELDAAQSLQLFSWHAFGKQEPDAKFTKLSVEVASIAAGLPLALTVFGSHFFDLDSIKQWRVMLEKLKKDQHKHIHERLRLSFDVLEEEEKQVFLDIACFFVRKKVEHAILMWEDCGFFPYITINVLVHKSLVNIDFTTGRFEMHDHIRDMGRKIVQAESREPGMRSRLWKDDDQTLDILRNEKGTKHIEAINLNCPSTVSLEAESFAAMSQLRMLCLWNMTIEGEYKHFPKTLRWLKWSPQDLNSLPDGLHLENIVVLDLSRSSICQVWNPQGCAGIKVLKKLRVLNLRYCGNLTICPDFMSMPHLEKLDLGHCGKMTKLDPSIGHLKSLTHLSLEYCTSLNELPQEVWQLVSLRELELMFCYNITTLQSELGGLDSLTPLLLDKLKVLKLIYCKNLSRCPDFTRMPHLEELHLDGCKKMIELHSSIGLLKNLMHLSLRGCSSLHELPREVWQLTSLERLDLSCCYKIRLPSQRVEWKSLNQFLLVSLKELSLAHCSNLTMCPDFSIMPHLEKLDFQSCEKITELHQSLWKLKNLTNLCLCQCKSLRELPQEVGQLTSLEKLDLSYCHQILTLPLELGDLISLRELFLGSTGITTLPESMRHLTRLKRLSLSLCPCLKEIPESICSLLNLEELNAAKCDRLASLPKSIGSLKSLRKLGLSCTGIEDLPDSMVTLEKLEVLSVDFCRSLKFLPSSASLLLECHGKSSSASGDGLFGKACTGETLERQDCSLPRFPPSLVELNAAYCPQLEMIADVSYAKRLQKLDLSFCGRLVDVPGLEELKWLKSLNIGGCRSLRHSLKERLQVNKIFNGASDVAGPLAELHSLVGATCNG